MPNDRPPIHPGIILNEEFMNPYQLTQLQLSLELKISRKYLIDALHARKPISLELAQILAKFFQTSTEFLYQGQMVYDIWQSKEKPSLTLKKN